MRLMREMCEKTTCPTCGGERVVADPFGFWSEADKRGIQSDDMVALRLLAAELGIADDQYPDRNPGWLPPEEEQCHACGGSGEVCQERTALAYDRDGQVIVVRGVPGVVADDGEFLGYSEATVERLQTLVHRARSEHSGTELVMVEFESGCLIPMERQTREVG